VKLSNFTGLILVNQKIEQDEAIPSAQVGDCLVTLFLDPASAKTAQRKAGIDLMVATTPIGLL